MNKVEEVDLFCHGTSYLDAMQMVIDYCKKENRDPKHVVITDGEVGFTIEIYLYEKYVPNKE